MTKSQFAADSLLIVLAAILALCTLGTFGMMVKTGLVYAQLVGAAGALVALVVSASMALIAAASYPRPKMSANWSRLVQGLARVSMSAASILVVLSVGVCVFTWIVMRGARVFAAPNLSLFVLLCIGLMVALVIAHNLRSRSDATTVRAKRQIRVKRPEQNAKRGAQAGSLRTPQR